jgi:hypothetical protein
MKYVPMLQASTGYTISYRLYDIISLCENELIRRSTSLSRWSAPSLSLLHFNTKFNRNKNFFFKLVGVSVLRPV